MVGSLVVGARDAIDEARVRRKRMGGGMRQVGILAAAGLHALDHHVDRLADDHAHARLLAEACGLDPATVDTNIVVVERSDTAAFVAAAADQDVRVATGVPFAEYGAIASVLSVCLSKGLGAPVGSLMVGSRDAIDEARVRRKRMGGGMRQAGILAAGGLHALDHHVDRLADDHAHAKLLAEACGLDPATVDTNIVVVERSDAAAFVAAAAEGGVRVATVGPTTVRMVTHLDVSRADAERAAAVLSRL